MLVQLRSENQNRGEAQSLGPAAVSGLGELNRMAGRRNQAMEEQASSKTIGCRTIAGVVIFLAVIAAVLFPVFVRHPGHGRSRCQYSLKELAIALKMYADDYGNRLPSSLIRDPKTRSFIPEFCTEISPPSEPPRPPAHTYADVLLPYIKSRDLFFCYEDNLPTSPPARLVSYIYRPAVDQAAVIGHGKEKDFEYPASQMVFFERLGFHGGQTDEGWKAGVKLSCAFMEAHVQFVAAPDTTMSNVPRADISDEPGPALNKALNQPGWPCWFNYDVKTKTGVKRKEWDPRRYRDEVR